jgi:hypothetical protein
MQVADDLVVGKWTPWPAILPRLKKTIPPQLLDDEKGADKDANWRKRPRRSASSRRRRP